MGSLDSAGEAHRLLAHIHESSRDESDYVINTWGLDVAKYQRSITSDASEVLR